MQPSYELITDPARLFALRREWDDLCARSSGHHLAQTFDWARVSWQTVAAPRGRALRCLIERRDGRLGLIWPLVTLSDRRWTVAQPLGSETSEYSTILIEDAADRDRRAQLAWRELRARCACDAFSFENVPSGSPLDAVIAGAAQPTLAYPMHLRSAVWAGIEDWDTYHRSVSGTHRSGLRRKLKRLQELGDLRFETLTDPDRCEAVFDWMLRHKRNWLEKLNHRNDWILTSEYRSFLSASTAVFGPSGQRIVFALTLDGQPVAAELSSIDDARVEWFMAAHDPDYSKYSPGQLLKEKCLQWAFDHRLDYDMRIGDEPEKLIWCNRESTGNSYIVANSIKGGAIVRYRKLRMRLADRIGPERRAAIRAWLRPRRGAAAGARQPVDPSPE